MTQTKQVTTQVTESQVAEARGGYDPTGSTRRVVVTCPAGYDADLITAEDIVRDSQIRVVEVSR